jgi:ribonucleotide reductase alpha subunit
MEFIFSKEDNSELNNFNISVGVSDKFMEAAAKEEEYNLIDPREQNAVSALNATEVYQTLVKQAWKNGDPGIIFLDRINEDNPTPQLGDIESTNPCGEQPLLPMEACNLGSINLAKFVLENGDGPVIDYEGLKALVSATVRFLDNTIDMSRYPLPEIHEMVHGNRKIGLGVMGFADMLYQLGGAGDGRNGHAFLTGKRPRNVPESGGGARGISQLGKKHIQRSGRQTAQCDLHHHRPHGNVEHHRRLLQRHRAPVCTEFCAQRNGQRQTAGSQSLF